MKNKKKAILALFFGVFFSTLTSFVSCQTTIQEPCKNDISKIELTNRSFRDRLPKTLTITDSVKLGYFCDELQNLHETGQRFNVKSNFGAYDLMVYRKNATIDYVSIIFTVYDGVVIRYNDKKFKNDALEWLILGWLDKAK